MKYERFAVRNCCKMIGIALKLGSVISMDLMALLVNAGLTESKSFTKAGILYIENKDLIVTGAFNTNILQIKCKNSDCTNTISIIEELLTAME